MRLFSTPPYRNIPELLDNVEGVSLQDLNTTLRDIRRANIFGLGTWVVKHHLRELLKGLDPEVPLRILDIATGSGDIPEELCRWAGKEGRTVNFTATDISPQILAVARQRIIKAGFGRQVDFVATDATAVPFPDRSFDVAICSLAFHHLDIGQARAALYEMFRLSRTGFIINDVYRSQGAWYMAWLLTHLTTNNKLTRHDGPTSVLRAYTPRELIRFSSGLDLRVSICKHPFWRMALIGRCAE